jgi:hypothetical protein
MLLVLVGIEYSQALNPLNCLGTRFHELPQTSEACLLSTGKFHPLVHLVVSVAERTDKLFQQRQLRGKGTSLCTTATHSLALAATIAYLSNVKGAVVIISAVFVLNQHIQSTWTAGRVAIAGPCPNRGANPRVPEWETYVSKRFPLSLSDEVLAMRQNGYTRNLHFPRQRRRCATLAFSNLVYRPPTLVGFWVFVFHVYMSHSATRTREDSQLSVSFGLDRSLAIPFLLDFPHVTLSTRKLVHGQLSGKIW